MKYNQDKIMMSLMGRINTEYMVPRRKKIDSSVGRKLIHKS